MPQQKGASTSCMFGIENVAYKTAATTGFILPINFGEGVIGSQSINATNTIRGNRNPNQGFRGNREVTGSVPIPVDSSAMPYWLTGTFGDPTSAGSDPYTHEWKVANTQPSFTYEKAFTDLTTDRYARFVGCKTQQIAMDCGGDQELTANFTIFGASDSWETSAFDASPTTISLSRINNFDGAVAIGGTSSDIITKASFTIDLGLDTRADIIPIGNQGVRSELPEGAIQVSGNITALFNDDGYTLMALGAAGTESSLKLTFTRSASSIFEVEFQEIEFSRTGVPIDVPEGLLINMDFTAFYENEDEASAVVFRVTNSVASYNLVT